MAAQPISTAPLAPPDPLIRPPTIAYVDAAFLKRAACRVLDVPAATRNLEPMAVRDWLLTGPGACRPGEIQRVGWYQGAFDATDPRGVAQRRYLHAIAEMDLIQTRLGRAIEIHPQWHDDVRAGLAHAGADVVRFEERCPLTPELRQKGVDMKLGSDLVLHTVRGAIGHAVLIAGDGDFVPVVKIARKAGVLITLVTPDRGAVAATLRALADRTIEIPVAQLAPLLSARPTRSRPRPITVDRPGERNRCAPAGLGHRPGQSVASDRRALRAVTGPPVANADSETAAPEADRRSARAATSPEPRRPGTVGDDLLVGPYRDGDRVGLTMATSRGSATIYLRHRQDDPDIVDVFVGDPAEPSHDRRVGSHRPLHKLQPVA